MAMELNIVGFSTGNRAEVSTNRALRVTGEDAALANDGAGNPQIKAYGPPAIFEYDAGNVTGSVGQRQGDISANYRQRVGIDNLIFCDQFGGTQLNTSLWSETSTTFTTAQAGGWRTINSASVTTTNAVTVLQTRRGFPIFGAYPLQIEIEAFISAVDQANNVIELGVGIVSGTAAPTDGAFYRFTSSGQFQCVVNYGGSEISVTPAASGIPTSNARHHYNLVLGNDFTEFWIDNVLVANIPVAAGNAMPVQNNQAPVICRMYNGAVAPATAVQLKIGQVTVSVGDMNSSKGWSHVMAGMGGHASQTQSTWAPGQTTQYANSANPTAAVPTNTTAALGTGLGGLFQETDTLAVNTDGIISSYQVPANAIGVQGKTLYVTRITISSVVATALTGGGYGAIWGVAYGHTAVSLATTESATTKAPRRMSLGCVGVASGAAAGTTLTAIDLDFNTPIAVQPGEFFQIIRRKIGAAPTAGALLHSISIGGYWE